MLVSVQSPGRQKAASHNSHEEISEMAQYYIGIARRPRVLDALSGPIFADVAAVFRTVGHQQHSARDASDTRYSSSFSAPRLLAALPLHCLYDSEVIVGRLAGLSLDRRLRSTSLETSGFRARRLWMSRVPLAPSGRLAIAVKMLPSSEPWSTSGSAASSRHRQDALVYFSVMPPLVRRMYVRCVSTLCCLV